MAMNNIKEFLLSIGLGKNETEVYAALVEMGASSVLAISKKTGLHRSNIYDSLRSLLHKSLVFEIDEQTKLFSARPPSSLINYIKQKEIELNVIIKEYEKRSVSKSNEGKVKLSKGVFAVREALHSLLEKNKPIIVFGIPDKAPEIIGPILKDFHRERIKKKILMRHIYNSNALVRAKHINRLAHTEARVSSSRNDALATTNICDDKVIFFLWQDEMSVIEIEDKDISQAYQKYFEILWKNSKKLV